MTQLRIVRAGHDLLFDEDGRRYVDLFSGHGATWLGHCHPAVMAEVRAQLDRVWISGGLETPVFAQAKALIESFFPASHCLAQLYSTGMEAAEFALRVARVVTKKTGAIGFAKSMHGKSLATAFLGWDNNDNLQLPGFVRLPFVPTYSEAEILRQLESTLQSQPISAVFVEPLHSSGGGHMASTGFYRDVARLCKDHHVLLVFDEILTGFCRTGPAFFFSDLGFVPDVILIGKALGNGFPVSGVVVNKDFPIVTEMLPGSTFAGNPLAAAAVVGTLRQMQSMDLPARVAQIEFAITESLSPLCKLGLQLRGRGALWVVELPSGPDIWDIIVRIYERGVCVGYTGRLLRILPAATIGLVNLQFACSVVRDELMRAYQ